jgi:hypothetical protein
MLELPKGWPDYTAGAVATDLVGQAGDRWLRAEAWRHMIGAVLQGLVDGWATKKDKRIPVIEEPNSVWRINDMVFVFVREVDYDWLDEAVALGSRANCLQLLTPPRRDTLLHTILAALLGDRVPMVSAVDTYISFRNLMDQGDFGWTGEEALLRLFTEYNKRIRSAHAPVSMLIDLPPA